MKNRQILLRFGLVLGILVAIFFAIYLLSPKKNSLKVSYREALVKRGSIRVNILATGTVQPENRLEIKPPVSGRVEGVLVKEGQRVRKGQVLAWMSSTERAALLDAARAQGEGEYQKWQEMVRPTPILAPISGTLILRNVESGQTFTNTESVFVMSDRLTIKAQVDETDIAQVKLHQAAELVLDAYPGHRFPGRVDQIAFDAKTVNNVTTYDVDVLPESVPEFMRSGMTANVTFLITQRDQVILVPNEALRVREGKTLVSKKGADSWSDSREIGVETGITDGKVTEVLAGLQEGDVILIAEVSAPQSKTTQSPFMPHGMGRGRR